MEQNKKTEFYDDVKSYIFAGMEFGTKNYKLKKVGYNIVRIYFDSKEKDLTIGQEKIKTIFYK